ncbi:DUF5123 domain-containing protein [Bacteroides sp. BFG-606]|uniref:DUF5123 domain-containing protein n=1 Tax=Bacteroides sp. BFG-606 TaxID=2972763 RepID=UPI002166632F|nr:DUF5123 domain-containing protein [Bacteroides sp. BFG-606]MCS2333643.1 DUF5123 domain-containing protein [Bacteroides sp. BFG-606]
MNKTSTFFRKLLSILPIIILCFACSDSERQFQEGIFRPKLVAGYPIVEANTFKLLWYQVDNAESYTVQVFKDDLYTDLIDEVTISETSYKSPKLPYSTLFYVRLKTNTANDISSIWCEVKIATDDRAIPSILNEVADKNISENGVVITWNVNDEYPVDSITVSKLEVNEDGTYSKPIEIELTEEQYLRGSYNILGLKEATTYVVTVYNSRIEDVYERPYNSIKFKTAGPPEGSIVVNPDDDLNAILKANEAREDIPDGQAYYIKGGASFDLEGYSFTKGFQLIGVVGTTTTINVKSPFTPNGNSAGKIIFTNISLQGEVALIINELSDGLNYIWQGLKIEKCSISAFPSGFVMVNSSVGNNKRIIDITIDDCVFHDMEGGALVATDKFSDLNGVIAIDKISITNSTFMNSPKMTLLFLPDAYGNSKTDIELFMQNVTVFEALGQPGSGARVIQANKLQKTSQITILKCLFSNVENAYNDTYAFYELCLSGSAVTTYKDNYRTGSASESSRNSKEITTNLNVPQEDLFVDYSKGILQIKDPSSVIYLNNIGDPRWIE